MKNLPLFVILFLSSFRTSVLSCAVIGILALSIARDAYANFSPDAVGIVANKNSEASMEIAKHYAKARQIPERNILTLDVPDNESIDRSAFEKRVVLPLRQQIESLGIESTLKVLVTTYGLPLRINPAKPSAGEREQQAALTAALKQSQDGLRKIIQESAAFATDTPDPRSTADLASLSDKELLQRTNETLHAAGKRMEATDVALRTPALNIKFSNLISQFGGLAAVSKLLRPASDADQERSNQRIQQIKEHLQSAQKILTLLDELPSPVNQKRALQLTKKIYGAAGLLQRSQALLKRFDPRSSDASFESELSLLWWDADLYPLADRVANPWYHRLLQQGKPNAPIPVVFVSRLDAPQPEQVLKLIDASLRAEKEGLQGKAFFDARGLKEGEQSYIDYDESIIKTAELFRANSPYEVTIDTSDRTFSKKDEAADTAVYVGWYRLRNYEDAFSFAPGSIGFHVASEEAVSIRKPGEKGWCSNALSRGIAATIGAVAEPFLDSFPKSHEFFGFLLSGKYTLVESYYLSSPYLSWRLTLFGDPLYSPWKGKNLVDGKHIADLSPGSRNLSTLPEAPLNLPLRDPTSARKAMIEKREKLKSELDQFFVRVDDQAKALQESMKNQAAHEKMSR